MCQKNIVERDARCHSWYATFLWMKFSQYSSQTKWRKKQPFQREVFKNILLKKYKKNTTKTECKYSDNLNRARLYCLKKTIVPKVWKISYYLDKQYVIMFYLVNVGNINLAFTNLSSFVECQSSTKCIIVYALICCIPPRISNNQNEHPSYNNTAVQLTRTDIMSIMCNYFIILTINVVGLFISHISL